MQKNNYDSDFCGKVPLHQTNLIQPHGVLLIVDRKDLRIVQASENAAVIFGMEARELVSKYFHELVKEVNRDDLCRRFSELKQKTLLDLCFSSGHHLAFVKPEQDYFLIETGIEKHPAPGAFPGMNQQLKDALEKIASASTMAGILDLVVSELKRISGFDKVMIYKFDEDWNGDVIAEQGEAGMEKYLGLKFPASDIPKQARELYRKFPYRLIPDRNYQPVKLYPVINPITKAFTDLSDSNLRSVAAVHLEYLANMGVVASMSTRILVDEGLWGLISCHHRTAKFLSFETLYFFEILSVFISSRIADLQRLNRLALRDRMQTCYRQLVEGIYEKGTLTNGLESNVAQVLQVLHSDGVAFLLDGAVSSFGSVPSGPEIMELGMWLQSGQKSEVYHQPGLSKAFEPAEKYSREAAGLLALPLDKTGDNYILAFRPEARITVNWGGNPQDAVQFEADRKTYHPRASFKLWQQVVEQTSVPWTPAELELAEQFKQFAVGFSQNRILN